MAQREDVAMTIKAKRPRVGDEAWLVEWCTKAPLLDDAHPEYGGDPDRNEYETRRADTREEAERLAREVYPLEQMGAVRYWPARFTPYDDIDAADYPHAGRWEETGDAEYYEGDD
jgi:hypothetical protein